LLPNNRSRAVELLLRNDHPTRPAEQDISPKSRAYIDKFLYQFGLSDCKPISTPIEPLPLPENEPEYIYPSDQKVEYQRVAGSLMYIMLETRGDIAYTVSMISRYLANPRP